MTERKRRIVVTGSKGLVGSHTFDYAKAQGADVLGVDIVGRGNLTDYISADLTDLGQVFDVLHGADAVIHLAAINAQLAKVEETARRHGSAVAIGHPKDATIAALAAWLPTLRQRGLVLVPISAIVRQSMAAAK